MPLLLELWLSSHMNLQKSKNFVLYSGENTWPKNVELHNECIRKLLPHDFESYYCSSFNSSRTIFYIVSPTYDQTIEVKRTEQNDHMYKGSHKQKTFSTIQGAVELVMKYCQEIAKNNIRQERLGRATTQKRKKKSTFWQVNTSSCCMLNLPMREMLYSKPQLNDWFIC